MIGYPKALEAARDYALCPSRKICSLSYILNLLLTRLAGLRLLDIS